MALILILSLVALIIISAFFSSSETGMMSLNRYRLRHLAKKKHPAARRAQKLLRRPDRLLGVILLGNTFANILASSIATVLAIGWFGDKGVLLATIILTVVILIFAEIMPKTVAAVHPEGIAFFASRPLQFLLKIVYPLVWLLSIIANRVIAVFGVRVGEKKLDSLTTDELRSVVHASEGDLPQQRKHMLLGVLELESATIAEVLIPRHRITGIDVTEPWPDIRQQLIQSHYSKLPIYAQDIDQCFGILPLRKALSLISNSDAGIEQLKALIEPAYFIPESTTLQTQLINFQKNGERLAMVVDEYGDIQGLATVEDIIEEVVGRFADEQQLSNQRQIIRQKDGTVIVDAHMTVRDINRELDLALPIHGAKTLSGLITDYLETLPNASSCVLIDGYPIEILHVDDQSVYRAKIQPRHSEPSDE